jgi:2-succinyl-5-enolpyruvyl-6-hydroxy-3-cyclohexene-1-carboxylate synthase
MPLDFRNLNTLWASVLVETLQRLGLTTAVICPGSRSTPLAVAFAQHPEIEAIPVLDERSAAFFALGIGKRAGIPVALVCTSGTAAANFYPAIVEAKESRVPLLVLTADRPPELRHCHAGQTIDQMKLYGHYPNWQAEVAVPAADRSLLSYLRQTLVQAWARSRFPTAGSVHLNLPFRDPLAPIVQPEIEAIASQFDEKDFFAGLSADLASFTSSASTFSLQDWQGCERGIIIAGVAHTHQPKEYSQAIAQLSRHLQYPVLAEALSPLRNYAALNPHLIATYDSILRNPRLAQQLAPEIVIQLGELPTSKELRAWLEAIQPQRWIIDASAENFDPLHGKTIHLRTSIEAFVKHLEPSKPPAESRQPPAFWQQWCQADQQVRQKIEQTMRSLDFLLEGKAAWLLSQTLPTDTPIFIANSMPVRNVEFFWMPRNSGIAPYFNRGANGIDGTLSTALGIAHRHQSSVLLTGDLALLHDTNGLLITPKFVGHLTIVLINNQGGGIFETLPIAQFEPLFEEFFATPQPIDFAQLCLTYGIEHQRIGDWQQLEKLLNPLPEKGIRVLELQTNRKVDASWLQANLGKLALDIQLDGEHLSSTRRRKF